MYTAAATMPSPGIFVIRPQLMFESFGATPGTNTSGTDRYEFSTTLQYGLARGFSLTLEIPAGIEVRQNATTGERKTDKGISNPDLTLKYRFYKDDSGGIDTTRAALLTGFNFPSGDDRDFSSPTVNPFVGVVLTVVRGRHGFNQELSYRLNTNGAGVDNLGGGAGPADAFRFNSAYLYRIYPDRFASDSNGAWYLTAEMNGLYETNSDLELRWAPGLMYEGREFAFELMAQLPLYQHVRKRAELDFAVGVGIRISF